LKRLLAAVLILCFPVHAVTMVRTQVRHHKTPKPLPYLAFPPSRQSLIDQNTEADRLGLHRFLDKDELAAAVERGDLVPLPLSVSLGVDKRLDPKRRYVRPWVSQFLFDLSDSFYQTWHQPLLVDSAVRTVQVQRSLIRWNKNAAPAHGELASVHLAGIAVDIARRPLTNQQIRWLEFHLEYYHALGLVIVEEELKQPCFHIVVSGDYPNGHIKIDEPIDGTPDRIEDVPQDQPN
jgi:Family of unknown function (DUF5715)